MVLTIWITLDNIKIGVKQLNMEGSEKILNRPLNSNEDNNAQSDPIDSDAKKVYFN